jgi:tetratricopeptide (TPR) repeat protein
MKIKHGLKERELLAYLLAISNKKFGKFIKKIFMIMRNIYLILFFLLISLRCYAIDKATESQAQGLLVEKKYDDAYALLLKSHEADSKDPQEWFLLGMSAKMIGRTAEAMKAYEKVLALDPTSPRVKLEMASICYSDGQYDQAKALLLEVKAENLPLNVKQNIDRFLAVVERSKKQNKPYRFTVSTGILYDTNVNAGPSSDMVTILGFPFTLDANAKPKNDLAYSLSVGFDSTIKVSQKVNWQSSVLISRREYDTEHDYSTFMLQGSTGALFTLGNRVIISVPLQADMAWYGGSQGYYLTDVGIAPQVQYALNKNSKLNLNTGLYNRDYRIDNNRDALICSLSPGFDYTPYERLSIQGFLGLGKENANNNIYSNKNWDLNIAVMYAFRNDLISRISCGYGRSFYEEQMAIYTEKRNDRWIRLGFDLRYNYQPFDADIIFSTSYIRNKSALELYDYDRSTVSLTLNKYF